MRTVLEKLIRAGRRLRRDAGGGIILPLALALPVLFGFGMLAIDGGRYFNLQTSLQVGADALALAGAAELDGKSDSIVRADRAIDTLVANDQRFGEGAQTITRAGISVRYLKSLPTTDGEAITDTYVTTDPTKAGFVEVNILPVSFHNIFAAAAQAVNVPTRTQASAVAGFDSVACNVAPLFMCNPAEDSGTSLNALARQNSFKRRLIALRDKSNQPGSGNYGFLVPPEGNSGAANVSDALSIDKPAGCYTKTGVEVRPGFIAATANAMNVRFDLYEGGFKNSKGDHAYRPAANVRKGFTGLGCLKQATTDHILPRDPCFATDTCADFPVMGGSIGGGDWDFEGYWKKVYPALPFPVDPETGSTWSNTNRPSRYEVYRYEIANNLTILPSGGVAAGDAKKGIGAVVEDASLGAPGEVGTPQCYTGDKEALKTDPLDRRVFVGAILDCRAHSAEINGASGGKIPVTAYGKFFLTEPMDPNDSRGTIWVEMIELVEPGTVAARNIIRDSIQLVR